jgi:2'-5' RNA ligase
MEEPRAKGISLWLMPEGDAHERLSEIIDRLAVRLGTTPFPPHVTLLPGVLAPPPAVVEGARLLAGDLVPLPVGFSVVDGVDQHFRCLFLPVQDGLSLRSAHSRAARQFGREPDPSFDPHLSLVYGTLDPTEKAGLVAELAGGATTSFEARRLHVWQTDGPVGEWREIAAFDLGLQESF